MEHSSPTNSVCRVNRILCILLFLAHGLWFGGLITLFTLTTALRKFDIEITRRAATPIFAAFEVYHLIVGGLTLVLLVAAWRLTSASRWRTLAAGCFGVALAAAIMSAGLITPRLEQLRRDGHLGTPTFRSVHTASMVCYGIETIAVLTAGVALPLSNLQNRHRATSPATEHQSSATPAPVPHSYGGR